MKQLIYFIFLLLFSVLISCKIKPDSSMNDLECINGNDDNIESTNKQLSAKNYNYQPAKKLELKKNSLIDLQSAHLHLGEISDSDEMASEYKKWNLSSSEILTILRNGEAINSHDFSYLYYVLPCEMRGSAMIDSSMYSFKINAGSYFILSNADTSYYFGCSNIKCKKYFLMTGGSPVRDLGQ
ncbi:hypothetical protein DVR12_23075 [Chitinophaga silvatica]|uniref:Lipoprotein n=1 Tax=Chitinophaga silvatica TaxID=2282649 RepID=A0A3E1Y469_9BACT|nr:hypothetical protein [Chitinophaga silvatica]RFS19520.1 hypothetical protein DVR12_23075 [Chitinophaga silvatica]